MITNGSLPRLSQVVTKLERRGWVKREPDPNDGRTTLAVLTGSGMKTLERAAPAHVERVRQLVFDPLTKAQVRQLRDISQRIRRTIGPGYDNLLSIT
jgi:DNA-binding MarR family transcriptional regulator